MKGKVRSIAIGHKKGKPKKEIKAGTFFAGYGLVEDAHAGPGPRQVGLLSAADFDGARRKLPEAMPGSFAENLIIAGIDFTELHSGSRLKIGEAVLEITERGKAEWKKGDYSFRGLPLLARRGLFARVLAGGNLKKGDNVKLIKRQEGEP